MRSTRKVLRSLQFQLVVISTTAMVGVLCWAGGMATWRLNRELLTQTKMDHEQVVKQFSQAVTTYQEMYPPKDSLTRAVERYTQPNLWLKVFGSDGRLIAASDAIRNTPISNPFPSMIPELRLEGDRALILCGGSLILKDGSTVKYEAVSDVTQAYQAYQAFLQTLLLSGTISVLLASLTGLILIRRSLRPLRKISQVAATISVEQLQDARLMLMDPPTEVQNLAEAFNAMLNRLSLSWEQEQQLLSNLSHELRTPLAIVQGYLESTLRRGSNLSEIQTESLTISLQETQRVVRLLKGLLELARAEAGSLHLQMEPLLLNDFMQDLAAIIPQLGSNPVTLHLSEQPIMVNVDRDRLKQIMLNLITNAIRYSDHGSPITLRLVHIGETASLQVQDRGIGIPLEHQSHIFDRFYCVSESRSRTEGGIGLGLAITKTLIEQMRGKISVESQPQVGSTFTVSLPILDL